MLFDIVPENFFHPLAAKSKIAYWECICIIYRITSAQLSFGAERDVLTDELQYYFESNMSADISDEDDYSAGETSAISAHDKANLMIRRLERYGWIYIDTDLNYVQRVNFRDYAISVIRGLLSLETEKHPEYQGYIYTIYNLAKAGTEHPGLALMQIVDNTEALITGLKSLNANIKKYIDTLTRHSTIQEILDALLNDYYTNIVDKAYHRLMTSDNVSKFRPFIIDKLESDSRSRKYLEKASADISEIREIPVQEAKEQVLSMLHSVVNAFRQLDDIIEDINKKNTKYQRSAINRARFLLSSSDDIRGQLKNIISFMNEQAQKTRTDHNTIYELEQTDRLFKLFASAYLNNDSLYSPIEGRKKFIPQNVDEVLVDEKIRNEKRLRMKEKLERGLTPEKINLYVSELLGDRNLISASEIDISDVEVFIKLIYIRLYGVRKNMCYLLETGNIIEKDGYRFRDYIIRRKEQ